MAGVGVDSRTRIDSKMEPGFGSGITASEAFAASGLNSSSAGSAINAFISSKAPHRSSCGVELDRRHSVRR